METINQNIPAKSTKFYSSRVFLFFFCVCCFLLFIYFYVFLLYFSITIYPTSTLFNLYPPSSSLPQSPHCHPVHKPFFFFARSLQAPTPAPIPELSACYLWVCLYFACLFSLFIRFHIWVESYSICLSLTGLFHLA